MNDVTFKMWIDYQKNNKYKFPKKVPVTTYPYAIEKVYAKYIGNMHEIFIDKVVEKLKRYLSNGLLTTRKDAFSDEYDAFMKEIDDELIALYGASFLWDSKVSLALLEISGSVYKFNTNQWNKQIAKFLGIPYTALHTWWEDTQRAWVRVNYDYMKSQAEDFVKKLQILLVLAIQSLWTKAELFEEIGVLILKFTEQRAAFLARDQIGKLNGNYWRNAYGDIGLSYYIWKTAGDERVRGNPTGKYPNAIPSHWIMEGLLMDWNNPSIYSDDSGKTWKLKHGIMEPLHVGMAPGCRCVPIPYFNAFLENIPEKQE